VRAPSSVGARAVTVKTRPLVATKPLETCSTPAAKTATSSSSVRSKIVSADPGCTLSG
jgi:hypothetical protein